MQFAEIAMWNEVGFMRMPEPCGSGKCDQLKN